MTDKEKGFFNGMFDGVFDDLRAFPKKTSIKIALIGDGSTGKTSYFNRVIAEDSVDYKFNKAYDATQQCNVCRIEYVIGKYPVTIHLFDTAGQEKFGTLRDSYLMGVDGIIVMYDITDKTTRNNVLVKWLPDVKKLLNATKSNAHVPVMVVGNKSDKCTTVDWSSFTDGTETEAGPGIRVATLTGAYERRKYGPVNHCLVSVKANENLMEPINWILQHVQEYYFEVKIKRTNKQTYVSYCNK
jgi:small GTP-binding protein